jgi:hypothetical protein
LIPISFRVRRFFQMVLPNKEVFKHTAKSLR